MRRGLLKDLTNTPTQIACGWRLYGDLKRLSELAGSVVIIDLLGGTSTVDGHELSPQLESAAKRSIGCTNDFSATVYRPAPSQPRRSLSNPATTRGDDWLWTAVRR